MFVSLTSHLKTIFMSCAFMLLTLLYSQHSLAQFVVTATGNKTSVARSETIRLTVSVRNNSSTASNSRIVSLQVLRSDYTALAQRHIDAQNFAANETKTYVYDVQIPQNAQVASYGLSVGVMTSSWQSIYWADNHFRFNVTAGMATPTPTPRPTATPTPTPRPTATPKPTPRPTATPTPTPRPTATPTPTPRPTATPTPTPRPTATPTPTPRPTATPTPTPRPTATPTPTPAPNGDWRPRNSARVFFSGHSLIDNPLPDFFADAAQKKGDSIAWNQQNVIGSPIRIRTRGGNSNGSSWEGYLVGKNREGEGMNVVNELRNPQTIGAGQRYDTLVLTERHDSISVIQWENTIGYSRHFHDRLIEGNPNAKTLLYHAWLDVNKNNPANWIDHEKKALYLWECVASKVNHTLESVNRTDRMRVLPAGRALVDLVERVINNEVPGITGTTANKLNMIFTDNVHLTDLGIYYMSLVTYASVYGKSAAGATPPISVSSSTASALQTIAWNYVSSYYGQANAGTHTMQQCRDYVATQVCPSYHTLMNSTGDISGCQGFYGSSSQSPFRWPDSSWQPLPAP